MTSFILTLDELHNIIEKCIRKPSNKTTGRIWQHGLNVKSFGNMASMRTLPKFLKMTTTPGRMLSSNFIFTTCGISTKSSATKTKLKRLNPKKFKYSDDLINGHQNIGNILVLDFLVPVVIQMGS